MHRRRLHEPIVRRSLAMLGIVALFTTAGLIILAFHGADRPPPTMTLPDGAEALVGHIESVTDGDTVVVDFGTAGTERVRLLGIDTPETVKPGSPVECWGPEASARAEDLLPEGTKVLGRRDVEARDRYGRLLLYLWRAEDGLFVNRVLLEEGHAVTLAIAPNNAYRAEFSSVAASARDAKLGVWGRCGARP